VGHLWACALPVSGEGILISNGGKVVDAVAAAAGLLQSVAVTVGDHVTQGQPIAQIIQTDIEQKYKAAVEVFHAREHEYKDLNSKIARELAAKSQNFQKLEAAFEQVSGQLASASITSRLTSEISRICSRRAIRRGAISRSVVRN